MDDEPDEGYICDYCAEEVSESELTFCEPDIAGLCIACGRYIADE